LFPGGFVSFWYHYFLINKNFILNNEIICASASCLAVIAKITYPNLDNLLKLCFSMQNDYLYDNKTIKDINQKFIKNIIKNINIKKYSIKILVSTQYGFCKYINPKNLEELYNYLIYTTYIPLITGNKLSLYYDGAFCFMNYPKCKKFYIFPLNYFYISNIFNPKLRVDDLNLIKNDTIYNY
jgi:hypothetical protein